MQWQFQEEVKINPEHELSLEAQLGQIYNIPATQEAFDRSAAKYLSEESLAKLEKLMQGISKCTRYSDKRLEEIIIEAVNAYIAGDKSLEDTVALIQSRASILVAEQYG